MVEEPKTGVDLENPKAGQVIDFTQMKKKKKKAKKVPEGKPKEAAADGDTSASAADNAEKKKKKVKEADSKCNLIIYYLTKVVLYLIVYVFLL